MNFITQLSRLFVGLLFIFSGFIKANDAIGFSYKLEEYFEVFGTHIFVPIALPLSIFICVFEIVLGFTLLLGVRVKETLWLLLLMIIFFTFLTFYSAYYQKVLSCGCFGDAIPLTPWQSFGKDIILLILILVLFIGQRYIHPILGYTLEKLVMAVVIIAFTIFPLYTYMYLPVIDFRAYKEGVDMYEAINPQMKYYYTLKNKQTQEVKEFEAWPPNYEKEWDYVDYKAVPVNADVKPIIGFVMTNEYGEDYTGEFLEKEGFKFMLVEYDLDKSDETIQSVVNDFAQDCAQEDIEFVAVTSSADSIINAFKEKHQVEYPFYINSDDVPLKTMIRSNPGLVLIKDGTIVKKWHHNSFPKFSDVKENYLNK